MILRPPTTTMSELFFLARIIDGPRRHRRCVVSTFFLFRFYFVDGVVTKLLAQYCSELVSSRIYEGE